MNGYQDTTPIKRFSETRGPPESPANIFIEIQYLLNVIQTNARTVTCYSIKLPKQTPSPSAGSVQIRFSLINTLFVLLCLLMQCGLSITRAV